MSNIFFVERDVTWLGIRVVHGVAIQLEQLHRLGLFFSVAAHGKCVLTHLQEIKEWG